MIRVCHLAKYFAPYKGGIETHVSTIANGQSRIGANVSVVCVNHVRRPATMRLAWPFSETSTEYNDGIQVLRVGRIATVARFDFCHGLRRELRRLSDAGIDVFHLHLPNPTMMVALASIPLSKPFVITHHSDIVRQKLLYQGLRPIEELIYGKADRVITTSPCYRAGSPVLQRHAHKVVECPFGVDLSPFFKPTDAALAAEKSLRSKYPGPLWLCVGRMVYYKGLNVALEALKHVPGTLLLVGRGPLLGKLRRQAEHLGVAGRVAWQSNLSDEQLVGAYRAAAALWFPSIVRSEAFGLVQVEAMACGCPVINCDIAHSGVPWVSPHELSGLTVPIADVMALANAATRLLEESGLRDRLANGAKRRAREHFDYRAMSDRSLSIYQDVLNQNASIANRLAA